MSLHLMFIASVIHSTRTFAKVVDKKVLITLKGAKQAITKYEEQGRGLRGFARQTGALLGRAGSYFETTLSVLPGGDFYALAALSLRLSLAPFRHAVLTQEVVSVLLDAAPVYLSHAERVLRLYPEDQDLQRSAAKLEIELRMTMDVLSTYFDVRSEIGWVPDRHQYLRRGKRHFAAGLAETTLPDGWPDKLAGPLVWDETGLEDFKQCTYTLNSQDVQEIRSATSGFKALQTDFFHLSRETFPLPTLSTTLAELTEQVHRGSGVVVLRGIDPRQFSEEENAIIFVGLSSYIAPKRGRQNPAGALLSMSRAMCDGNEIANLRWCICLTTTTRPSLGPTERQPFRTPRSPAAEGGENRIASIWDIYNRLAQSRPDIITLLAKDDWPHDTQVVCPNVDELHSPINRFGRNPAYHTRPLLHIADLKPIMIFARRLLTGSPMIPRTTGIPGLSEVQAEALDAVHFIAEETSRPLALAGGDIVFTNNLATLHSRGAFANTEYAKRHMMRLWLCNPEYAWRIPDSLQLAWDRIFPDSDRSDDFWPVTRKEQQRYKLRRNLSRSTSCG
ncbi:hypothetical protein KVT40_009319 [Elsinoe batatas]|uniref:TauD/TfdA-like domain-containing protein n=1 Tax=Elsinoe batatas TaxID=2601811 RepID=A0A8K0KYY8_9PEZI|nr:hypothetical protein KVT40_009319 [Elsinoe batatas]